MLLFVFNTIKPVNNRFSIFTKMKNDLNEIKKLNKLIKFADKSLNIYK